MKRPTPKYLLPLIAGSAILCALAVIVLSPVLTRSKMILFGMPFAGAFLVVFLLDARRAFIFILATRALLDPILEKTRSGGGTGLGGLLNLFVILIAALLLIRYPSKLKPVFRYVAGWGIFLLAAIITLKQAPLPSQTIRLWLAILTYAAMFVAPFFVVRGPEDKKFWIRLLIVSSFLPLAFCNLGLVVKHPMLYAFGRLSGTFTHSNILAFYLVLMIAVVFYVLVSKVIPLTFTKRWFLIGYLGNLLLILLVTETRSAWISCAALFLIYGFIKDRRYVFFCLIMALLLAATPPVQKRLADLGQGKGERRTEQLNSWAWRVRLWQDAWPHILEKPIFGHGLESFEYESSRFFSLGHGLGAPAHNTYVQLVYETGLAGLVSYLLVSLLLLSNLWKAMKRRLEPLATESAIAFAYLISYLIVGVSDNTLFYLAFNWYHWFFMGLLVVVVRTSSQKPLAPAQS